MIVFAMEVIKKVSIEFVKIISYDVVNSYIYSNSLQFDVADRYSPC